MQTSTFKKGLLGLTAVALSTALAGNVKAEGPTITGFVDVGYNYNLNGQITNGFRGYDDKSNSITLQNAELDFEGKANDTVGYRLDLMYGHDATVTRIGDTTRTPGTLDFEVQQAYLTFGCPFTGGTFALGKFVTPFGAEVIEAKDNFNISRGFLFNYAIPFAHTGLKMDKAFAEGKLTAMAGVVNGWDNMNDNNKSKTIIAQVGTAVLPMTKVLVGGSYGPEGVLESTSTAQNGRSLLDTVVIFTPTSKLTLVGNYDWGVQEGTIDTPVDGNSTQNWQGLGLHANYALTDVFSVAGRYEYLDDEGSRTGISSNNDGAVLKSGTLTLQAKKDSITYRLEYRQDQASQKVFIDSDGVADDVQSTIGAQVIYAF